jgi:hypothetical protein
MNFGKNREQLRLPGVACYRLDGAKAKRAAECDEKCKMCCRRSASAELFGNEP